MAYKHKILKLGVLQLLLLLSTIKLQLSSISEILPNVNMLYLFLVGVSLYSIIKKRGRFSSSKSISFLLVFSVCVLILSIYHYAETRNPYTIQYSSLLLLLSISALLISNLKLSSSSALRFFFYALIPIMILSIAYSLLNGHTRLDMAMGSGTATGAGLNGAILFLLAFYLKEKKEIRNSMFYFSITISIVAILYAFSRSIFVGLFAIGFFSLTSNILRSTISNYKIKLDSIKRFYFTALLILTIGISLIFTYSIVRPAEFEFLLSKLFLEETSKTSISRMMHIQYALVLLSDNVNNWLYGIGFEHYRFINFHYFQNFVDTNKEHTIHNMYLQYLVGAGLISITLFLLYIISLLSDIRSIKRRSERKLFFNILTLSIFLGLFQPLILSKHIFLIIPILVSLSLREERNAYQ